MAQLVMQMEVEGQDHGWVSMSDSTQFGAWHKREHSLTDGHSTALTKTLTSGLTRQVEEARSKRQSQQQVKTHIEREYFHISLCESRIYLDQIRGDGGKTNKINEAYLNSVEGRNLNSEGAWLYFSVHEGKHKYENCFLTFCELILLIHYANELSDTTYLSLHAVQRCIRRLSG